MLLLAVLAFALGACGEDDAEGVSAGDGGEVSLAELQGKLPAADDLGLEPERDFEWENATDFVVQGLFYSQSTTPSELIAAIDEAGFEAAVGSQLTDAPGKWHVWLSVAQFESQEDALQARDVLHEEDLKAPCAAACVVTPGEYELDGIPASAAVHHQPQEGAPPPGLFPFEGYLAEFVVGPQLFVVQTDSPPDWTSSAEFDELVRAVYEAASGSEEPASDADEISGAPDLTEFLMQKNEEPGFAVVDEPMTTTGVEAFVDELGLTEADAQRLRGEGFISFTHQPTEGPSSAGVTNVALYETAEGAERSMAHELRTDTIRSLGPVEGLRRFTVPEIPGARGWIASEPHVGNLHWVQGRCFFVLGNQGPGPFVGPLSTGARAIYERTNGQCP